MYTWNQDLRVRLRTIHVHWPRDAVGVGILVGDLNTESQKKGGFHVASQTFSDGDPGRTAMFRSVFLPPWRLRNQVTQRKKLLLTAPCVFFI